MTQFSGSTFGRYTRFWLIVSGVILLAVGAFLRLPWLREHLRQNGVQATARIDMLQDSGQVVGDERLFTMEMTLNPTTGTPRKLPAAAAMVPLAKSHKLFQGMNVPVRYETSNPNLLMVEWDKV